MADVPRLHHRNRVPSTLNPKNITRISNNPKTTCYHAPVKHTHVPVELTAARALADRAVLELSEILKTGAPHSEGLDPIETVCELVDLYRQAQAHLEFCTAVYSAPVPKERNP